VLFVGLNVSSEGNHFLSGGGRNGEARHAARRRYDGQYPKRILARDPAETTGKTQVRYAVRWRRRQFPLAELTWRRVQNDGARLLRLVPGAKVDFAEIH